MSSPKIVKCTIDTDQLTFKTDVMANRSPLT